MPKSACGCCTTPPPKWRAILTPPRIRNYGDEGYLAGVRAAIELLETVGHQRGAQGRLTELAQIFTTATQLESAFWQMGLNAS